VHQNTAVLKYTNSLKHKTYIYYARGMRLLQRLVERLFIMIRTLSIDSVGLNIFQCMVECFQCFFFFDFHLLSNCIIWGYWFLVMHEFTLALVGSTNAFILNHFFFRRMLLVDTPLNGWFLQLNNFQVHGDHGYCVHKHRSMSDVVLIVNPLHVLWWWRWFDTYASFKLQLCSPQGLLDMVAGPGDRRLCGRLSQGKSPSLEAVAFRQQDTQMDSLPFSFV